MIVVDLIEEYKRHLAEATTKSDRKLFETTLDKLERFRACFEQDFGAGERVRLALVLDSDSE